MVLDDALNYVKYLAVGEHGTDSIDAMNSVMTANLLIVFTLLISFKQFGGKPIECLVPPEMSKGWEQVPFLERIHCQF